MIIGHAISILSYGDILLGGSKIFPFLRIEAFLVHLPTQVVTDVSCGNIVVKSFHFKKELTRVRAPIHD